MSKNVYICRKLTKCATFYCHTHISVIIDLLVIDVMMPRLDGIRATLKIREENNMPIIILSAKSEDADKILITLLRQIDIYRLYNLFIIITN